MFILQDSTVFCYILHFCIIGANNKSKMIDDLIVRVGGLSISGKMLLTIPQKYLTMYLKKLSPSHWLLFMFQDIFLSVCYNLVFNSHSWWPKTCTVWHKSSKVDRKQTFWYLTSYCISVTLFSTFESIIIWRF